MRTLLTALVLACMACESPAEVDNKWAVPEEITFSSSLGIDLSQMTKTASGLYWQDITIGSDADGPPVTIDDTVAIHYRIWLPDGRQVVTTHGGPAEEKPILLLNPGLAEGVTGMLPEGTRKLVVRPELAYPNGNGPIPPRTTIIYEVELLWIDRHAGPMRSQNSPTKPISGTSS